MRRSKVTRRRWPDAQIEVTGRSSLTRNRWLHAQIEVTVAKRSKTRDHRSETIDSTGQGTGEETRQEEEETQKHDPGPFERKHLFSSPILCNLLRSSIPALFHTRKYSACQDTHGLLHAGLRQTNRIVARQVLPPMLSGENERQRREEPRCQSKACARRQEALA